MTAPWIEALPGPERVWRAVHPLLLVTALSMTIFARNALVTWMMLTAIGFVNLVFAQRLTRRVIDHNLELIKLATQQDQEIKRLQSQLQKD